RDQRHAEVFLDVHWRGEQPFVKRLPLTRPQASVSMRHEPLACLVGYKCPDFFVANVHRFIPSWPFDADKGPAPVPRIALPCVAIPADARRSAGGSGRARTEARPPRGTSAADRARPRASASFAAL